MDFVNKYDNYNQPKNYVCIEMPDHETCRKIRYEGIPYKGCERYSIAFKVNEDMTAGDVIFGWPGYAYECPYIPYWDKQGPWSILQSEFLKLKE